MQPGAMNIALPALVVFILLLPGFIARSRIKRAERLSLDYSPFGQVVTEAVLWAIALHLLWIGLAQVLTPREFRPEGLFRLFSTEAATQARALEALAAQAGWLAFYFVSLFAASALGPLLVRRLIVRYRLDRSGAPLAALFRFSGAPWYYLLSGADFAEDEVPDMIAVSAVVDVAAVPYLYVGILEDYFLTPDGELDRLILRQVMRRPFSADKAPGSSDRDLSRFYPVDGDCFVLRYREAITLNIEYIKLVLDEGEPA